MSDLNEVSRAIGSLEAQVKTLTGAVDSLNFTVQNLQQSKWTTKGFMLGLAALSGGIGGKVTSLFGLPPHT